MTEQQLTRLFAKHDPCGLIGMGAPPDNYSSEAKEVLSRPTPKTEAELGELFHQVFLYLFGHERIVGPREVYHEMAAEIWRSIV